MNGYAIYPLCVTVASLAQAKRLARNASDKPENDYAARVESCDTERIVARFRNGEEVEHA